MNTETTTDEYMLLFRGPHWDQGLSTDELQKAMLARVNQEFAFRVIDKADRPKWRSRPARVQLGALATVVGLLLGSLFVLARHALRENRTKGHESQAHESMSKSQ